MQIRFMTALALMAASLGAHAQNDGRPTWSIKTSTPTANLVGEWELSTPPGRTPTSKEISAAQVGVSSGASFQLKVKLVNPAGGTTDVTGSSKLSYRPQGCMSVNAKGVATVLKSAPPPWTCSPGDPIPLTIIYADQTTKVAAMNMYLFKIK